MLIERLVNGFIGLPQLTLLALMGLVWLVPLLLKKSGRGDHHRVQLWVVRAGLLGVLAALWLAGPGLGDGGKLSPGAVACSLLVGGPLLQAGLTLTGGEGLFCLVGLLGGTLVVFAGFMATFLLPLWWCNLNVPNGSSSHTKLLVLVLGALFGGVVASLGQGILPSLVGVVAAYLAVWRLAGRVRGLGDSSGGPQASGQSGWPTWRSRLLVMGGGGLAALGGGLLLLGGSGWGAPGATVGMVLVLAGLGSWLFMVPFGSWMSELVEEQPEWLSGLVMGVLPVAALTILFRLLLHTSGYGGGAEVAGGVQWAGWGGLMPQPGGPDTFLLLLLLMGGVAMVAGALLALVQSSLRRLLFCSVTAHWGFMLSLAVICFAGLGSAGNTPMMGTLIVQVARYLLFLSLAVWGILTVSALLARRTYRQHVPVFFSTLTGLGEAAPILAFAMMIFSISMAGMPPTGGFAGRQGLAGVAMEVLAGGGVVAALTGEGSLPGQVVLPALGSQDVVRTWGWIGASSVLLSAIILATPFLRLIINMYMRAAHLHPNWPVQCQVRRETGSVLAALVLLSGLMYLVRLFI